MRRKSTATASWPSWLGGPLQVAHVPAVAARQQGNAHGFFDHLHGT